MSMTNQVPVYNTNRGAVDWSQSLSNKRMRHYNIRENCARESIIEKETKVNHIAGLKNPGDLMTKAHKSDEIYRELRDIVVYEFPPPHLFAFIASMGGVSPRFLPFTFSC